MRNDQIRHYLKRRPFIFRQIYRQDVQKIHKRKVHREREGRFVKRRVPSTAQNVSPTTVPREKSKRPQKENGVRLTWKIITKTH